MRNALELELVYNEDFQGIEKHFANGISRCFKILFLNYVSATHRKTLQLNSMFAKMSQ